MFEKTVIFNLRYEYADAKKERYNLHHKYDSEGHTFSDYDVFLASPT